MRENTNDFLTRVKGKHTRRISNNFKCHGIQRKGKPLELIKLYENVIIYSRRSKGET